MIGSIPPRHHCCGDAGLLLLPRRAILVSRTGRHPTPASPWVRATVSAVRRIVDAGEVLVTGTGRDPYDLSLALCRGAGGAAIVALTGPPTEEVLEGSLPARCLLVWPGVPLAAQDDVELGQRDRLIGDLADRAFAVSVRSGGNMAAIAGALASRGLAVDSIPAVQAVGGSLREAPTPLSSSPLPGVWTFLTHYTREPEGAWPNETRQEFLSWLASGDPSARRGARDALRRILSKRRILASARLMPQHTPTVSFTGRPPWEMHEITHWMPSLRRWTFRPYGLAVERAALEALGARPVRYLSPDALRGLTGEERVFAQKHDPPRTDWTKEAEWRLQGDLELERLPADAVRVLVPRVADARTFEAEFGVQALPICT